MRYLTLSCALLALLVGCSDGNSGAGSRSREPVWQNTSQVHTNAGPVSGQAGPNSTWAWKGIPFAEPPLGALRFKAPRPPEPRTRVLEASDYGNACIQFDFLSGELAGDEDCLTLNIWRPMTDEAGLPVYVWIHGGGNTSGAASDPGYDGANLAAKNKVVFVSLQYRLGPFGWLFDEVLQEGEPLSDSGNFGTLDLIAGLKWIRDNIEQFGGNPDNVIISGESAGGINVLSLMLSPQAQGLFDKAISQSGFLANITLEAGQEFSDSIKPQIMVEEGLAPDVEQAQQMLDNMHPDEVRDLLVSAQPASIVNSIPQIGVGLLSMPSVFPDGVVIVSEGADAFDSGTYPNKVPAVIGTNTGDVRLFLFLLAPELLADPPLYNASADIGGMLWKAAGADEIAISMTRHSDQPPVYVYLFGWGRYQADGTGVTPAPWNYSMGAGHALDIPFFLDNLDEPGFFGDITFTEENRTGREALGEAMVRYMRGFLSSAAPSADGLPDWPAWSNNEGGGKYLELNADLMEARIRMRHEAVTTATALEALESIEDPVLREQVRTVLNEFVITCTLISESPGTECGVE